MQKASMQSKAINSGFSIDPRTKILLVFTFGVILITGSPEGLMNIVRPVLSFLPLALFAMMGRWKSSLKVAALYAVAFLAEALLVPHLTGTAGFIVVAVVGIFTRFLPCLAMGSYMVTTTTISEFISSMEKVHIPQSIIIPFAVMFRFFPTIKEESASINDAMRMRGIGLGGGNLVHMLEYRLVPLMMSVVKIGDELSAASLTRGLGSPTKRTNICKIGFGTFDIAMFALLIFAWIGFIIH